MNLKHAIATRARVLATLSLLGLLTPLLSQAYPGQEGAIPWLLDLTTHWQWIYLTGLILFGLLAALGDRRWLVLLLAFPLPWVTPAPAAMPATGPGALLSVMSANLHLDNAEAQPLRALLARERPDVVVLLELSPDYARQLEGLEAYPYRELAPDYGPFGIGLLSQLPLNGVRVVHDQDGVARIEANLDHAGQTVRLIAFHPMPPIEPRFHAQRNAMLEQLAQHHAEPTLIVGDVNASPWSSAFKGLDTTGLKRAGTLEGTWPAVMGGLGLPIDQVLVSDHWSIESFKVIDGLGSDHRAILVKLRKE